MERFYTVEEARKYTGLAKVTIHQAISRGFLTCHFDDTGHRKWLISKESLDEWRQNRKDNKYKRFTQKRCKYCGDTFSTVLKNEYFCSDECEEKFFELEDIGQNPDGVKPFTSHGTKGLTLAQQVRIIQDMLHPVTEDEVEKAVAKWMKNSDSILREWLKRHSIDEIKGKAVVVRR
mgnify:CR=1 FL=1